MASVPRVMVDARMLIGRFSGVARVVTRLVDELIRQGGIEIVALCGDTIYAPWADRSDIEIVRSTFGRRDRSWPRRVVWEETKLPGFISAAGVELFHATWNSGIPARCLVPSVLTIHDLIPWSRSDVSRSSTLHRLCYRYAVRASVRRATQITTVSDHVRRQVLHTLRADPDDVAAIPNGVDIPTLNRPDGEVESGGFALYVGGHEPRKNVAGVLRAMHCYRERYDPSLELRLTGRADSLSADACTALRRLSEPQALACANVRFLGDVSDAELTRQYAAARVLLMLSYEEGFGLPVLEAMACGCPVIAADRAALPEVVGDAGILVDPDQPEQAAEAMRTLITDPDRRAEFVRRGARRARKFGWDVAASRVRAVYERALGVTTRCSQLSDSRESTKSKQRSAAGPAASCIR